MIRLPGKSLAKLLAATTVCIILIALIHLTLYNDDLVLPSPLIPAFQNCTQQPEPVNTTIPNLIHQIWKTADIQTYPLPASHSAWKATFEPLNYTIKLWTDADVHALISTKYTWLLPTYEGYAHDVQRADVARLAIVHAEGGIYADLDVNPISPSDIACLQHLGIQGAFAPTGGNRGVSNHFFMAERGSTFLAWALEEAKRRGGMAGGVPLPYLRVFWSTGPMMVTMAFRKYLWMYGASRRELAVLDDTYVRTVVKHAAGRSWHGSDGQVLNYVADHARGDVLWVALSLVGVLLGFVLAMRRYRGTFADLLPRYIPIR